MEKFQLPSEYDNSELQKLANLLNENFPQFVREDNIDFDELKQYLTGIVPDDLQEKYSFTWHGKTESYRLLKKNSNGTLLPCVDESVNWDTTQNLYIEGDNMEVLKLIKHTYAGENGVKMVYIDPPYNSNEDFIYDDKFMDSLDKYLEYTNQKGIAMPEASGRYHTRWLNMMYPRLWLANYVLRDDGVIFISIDDREVTNLRKLCDEVFGTENFVAQTIRVSNSAKNNARLISSTHDYCLVYAKNKVLLAESDWKVKKNNLDEFMLRVNRLLKSGKNYYEIKNELMELVKYPRFYDFDHYYYVDENGVFRTDNAGGVANGNKDTIIIHPKTGNPCAMPQKGWRYNESTIREMENNQMWYFGNDETTIPLPKRYLKDYMYQVATGIQFYDSQMDAKKLQLEKLYFDFPKPVEYLKFFIGMCTTNNDIILDFFSGSSTTAHAVMQLNAEDGGNRKFIMVQLPEVCDGKSEAAKAGYKNICEIGKERIRRAGAKIAEQNPNVDVGFRVFKLDKSNFKVWDDTPIELKEEEKLYEQMEYFADSPFIDGRNHEDIVYEIMRMNNYPLTTKIYPIEVNEKFVYGVGEDCDFIICLDVLIDETVAEVLCKYRPGRILFTDSCFINTKVRINVEHTIRNINAKIKLRVV